MKIHTALAPFVALALLLAPFVDAARGAEPDPVFERPAVSIAEVKEVTGRLSELPVVTARFRQEKHVAALTRPMISEGEFIFARKHGVYWRIIKPFPSTFVVTPQGVRRGSGEKPGQPAQSDRPEIRAFSKIFLSLFSGDLSPIGEEFSIHFERGARWTIGLRAKSDRIGRYLSAIVLRGSRTVESVSLFEGEGDSSRIEFLDVSTPPELSAEERARFE